MQFASNDPFAELEASFMNYCASSVSRKQAVGGGSQQMDGRTLIKLCKDCGIMSKKLTKTDIDLTFAKVKLRGAKRIGFDQFVEALRVMSSKKGVGLEALVADIIVSGGPRSSGTVAEATRFHDDPAMYTGVYGAGGPTMTDNKINLSNLADRSAYDIRGRKVHQPSAHQRGVKGVAAQKMMGGEEFEARSVQGGTGSGALASGWYEVPNPNATGSHDAFYYVNSLTNETSWQIPHETRSPPPPPPAAPAPRPVEYQAEAAVRPATARQGAAQKTRRRMSGSNQGGAVDFSQYQTTSRASPAKPSGGGGIFDRLTDTSLYTGAHKARFDESGRGRGLQGRDRVVTGGGTHVPKSADKAYRGNTNTGSDHTFHDSSEFLNRR